MGTRPRPPLALLVCALSSGCARDARPPEAPDARPPRVVPRGLGDAELLEAAEWRLEGFPALSRDGRHVATVLSPSTGFRAIVNEANPNFDEPDGIAEYPNLYFVVVDARTGAIERRQLLVHSDDFDVAQRRRSQRALAATVRGRLAAMGRVLATGSYQAMRSVRLDGRARVRVDGVRLRVTAERLVATDPSGRPRLDVAIDGWKGEPLPMDGGFTCQYTPRIEAVAIDAAQSLAVLLVAQDTNGGDACAGAANADRTLKVLRLSGR